MSDSTVVVAGLWARPLAESARQAGWRVIALDLFGDADTRRASIHWESIGDASSFTIVPALVAPALQRAAGRPGVIGWIAGGGIEAHPELLELGIPGLPLLGMSAAAVRRVREPRSFFLLLDQLGLQHPEVTFERPAQLHGWLHKNASGSGGWHIRAASAAEPAGAADYYQRLQPGVPMSALFLADGQGFRLVGLNRLIVRPLGQLPFVYHGALGPIADDALRAQLQHALEQLVPALALRGLASLDFMAHEGRAWLLEINPRPSATMLLHAQAWPGGLLQAHVRAVGGALPDAPPAHAPGLRGCLTVYAPEDCQVTPALAAALARSPDCHDLPAPHTRFAAGEPVCNVSASADHADALLAALERRAAEVCHALLSPEEFAA
ncbi:ATP-grasp domain-containing protein [Ramlibacter sp.]|uniref:ATP-grasp domain-containing protein n=1 Tax=Ramlibacter sp. TaxID=1917967 RepID=UPI00261B8326|nr:ATP-grasp domain-containing protein [Ramlibacter sp.]MDB5955965.1 hypothetical protein [Ramlibacter sp.]